MRYQSPTRAMSSFKVVLISTSVLSAAIALKFSAPAIVDLAECLPSVYNGIVSWLRPPYLYLVINFIIITIVASSKLQSGKDNGAPPPPDDASTVAQLQLQPQPQPVATKSIPADYLTEEYKYDGGAPNESSGYKVEQGKGSELESLERADASSGVPPSAADGDESTMDKSSNKENEFVIAKSTWVVIPDNRGSSGNSPSKPPASARFGHRRNVKVSPEGVKTVLGVSRPKRHDTLESTWRTITEGRPVPITRHLKKSDTWERDNHRGGPLEKTPPPKTMKKAETFTDRTNSRSPSSGKLRREASPSQDELNRRVEAFIKKFNEDMRLQRQESLNQYMEMINRGAH
ncbi:Protein of unknown function (DUF761 [Striga hermonthica]|uniref:DUF4408 domain-containing protein n=1 Tax=Striga hermonthica TaxID=68872 RepID=A0A9N7MWJ4_STRHE|nr:Protein of unknown function (DUF761 [Striga hermonthica]